MDYSSDVLNARKRSPEEASYCHISSLCIYARPLLVDPQDIRQRSPTARSEPDVQRVLAPTTRRPCTHTYLDVDIRPVQTLNVRILVTKYRDESIPPIHARAAWLNFHPVAMPSSPVSPKYSSYLHSPLLREFPSSLDVPRRAQATAGALSGSIS